VNKDLYNVKCQISEFRCITEEMTVILTCRLYAQPPWQPVCVWTRTPTTTFGVVWGWVRGRTRTTITH